MKMLRAGALAMLMLVFTLPGCGASQPEGPAYEFGHGLWCDGHGFQERTLWAVAGRLAFGKPGRIDSVINLRGGYVVPAFAEAHNHNVESS